MWAYAYLHNLPEKLIKLGRNIAIQGEFCAPGIQKNRLKLHEPKLFIFDVVNLDTLEYMKLDDIRSIAGNLGLDIAPVEEEADSFSYTLAEMLEKARGKYSSGMNKEGIVVRSRENIGKYDSRISFKVINNDFLLKEED
jgi:hypothetical protein